MQNGLMNYGLHALIVIFFFDLTKTSQWGESLFECFEFFENEKELDVEIECEECKKLFIIEEIRY